MRAFDALAATGCALGRATSRWATSPTRPCRFSAGYGRAFTSQVPEAIHVRSPLGRIALSCSAPSSPPRMAASISINGIDWQK